MSAKVVNLSKDKSRRAWSIFGDLEPAICDLDRWASLSLYLCLDAMTGGEQEAIAEWQPLLIEQIAKATKSLRADYYKALEGSNEARDPKAS